MIKPLLVSVLVSAVLAASASVRADDTLDALGGRLKFQVPEAWKAAPPKSRIVEHELQAGAEDTDATARVTMMGAGGSIEANIQRWIDQFDPAGRSEPKQEKLTLAGHEVHFIEVQGTYKEMAAPFFGGQSVSCPDHALLGAIIAHTEAPRYQYFVKMVGPQEVVEANTKAFKEMIKEMKTAGGENRNPASE